MFNTLRPVVTFLEPRKESRVFGLFLVDRVRRRLVLPQGAKVAIKRQGRPPHTKVLTHSARKKGAATITHCPRHQKATLASNTQGTAIIASLVVLPPSQGC